MYSVVLWVLVHCMSLLSYCLFDHRFCRDFLCIPPISVHPFALVLHENVQVVCFNQSKFENVCKCKEWFEIRPLKLIKKYQSFILYFTQLQVLEDQINSPLFTLSTDHGSKLLFSLNYSFVPYFLKSYLYLRCKNIKQTLKKPSYTHS